MVVAHIAINRILCLILNSYIGLVDRVEDYGGVICATFIAVVGAEAVIVTRIAVFELVRAVSVLHSGAELPIPPFAAEALLVLTIAVVMGLVQIPALETVEHLNHPIWQSFLVVDGLQPIGGELSEKH